MRICTAPPFSSETVDETTRDAAGPAGNGTARWHAHDLLRLRHLRHFDGEPAWVRDAFAHAPFAVVRRAQAAAGFVAIGMRGTRRAERYGTWAQAFDVEATIAPEDLVDAAPLSNRRTLPAFIALTALQRDAANLKRFVWGPAGSVGFELATHVPTVTASSDLDLLIRAPESLPKEAAVALLAELQWHAEREGIRIDAQLETPAGGIALAELAAGKAHVIARHAQGPRLVADPWFVKTDDA
ncbi:malonate decarboxylase holo-ACP synthase [Paraburkholderia sp. GAS334]|jgi:phosphoribosyl-dephospho-CoA transferase|uniref:malonate decarboxylase holo-ACP synthase n=1 Tax=Paraburkholderia sp. GAS334 TaxID=3035131 RepID=UPI003D25CE80